MTSKEKSMLPPIKPEIRDHLKNVGFTEYFINIYIGLLDQGELNAHDLSELTGVPYSRIYEVLNEMIRKSMITKVDGRPSTFIANEPQEVFKAIKQKQEAEFETYSTECLPYLNQLFGEKQTVKNVTFAVYEGDQSCRDHLRNVINASARLLFMALVEIDEIYPIIKMNLDFLHTKGVEVRFILEDRYRNHNSIQDLGKYGKLRYLSKLEQDYLLSDEKTALQCNKGRFNLAKPSEKEY